MTSKRIALPRYSIGIGDRFGLEGRAQLRALKRAANEGVEVIPVWNKSNREHTIIGTEPLAARREADSAVRDEKWLLPYFCDADHVGLKTVDRFVSVCDFFTFDVADFIGRSAPEHETQNFIEALSPLLGKLHHPGLDEPITLAIHDLRVFAKNYLLALQEAGTINEHLKKVKGEGCFVTEVSIDEATKPQTPAELYLLLAGLAHFGVGVQTIAPKFCGKFLKGIDYVGDVTAFIREFKSDLAVVEIAKTAFELPSELKLSVHSGSDKFSLYPSMQTLLKQFNAGVHLKTAGTTWLEEVIGLAGHPQGLAIAKKIYSRAFERIEELRKPYETVVEINVSNLPNPAVVERWTSDDFVSTLRHDQTNPRLNLDLRQLVHIAFRIAAEMGEEFIAGLQNARGVIEQNVADNLYARHVQPLFLGR
jgi:hypothetical protein